MRTRIVDLQLVLIACILVGTACAKVVTLVSAVPLLETKDSLLGMRYSTVMVAATMLDMVGAGLLLVPRVTLRQKSFVSFAIGMAFAWYHVAGMLFGVQQQCPCLGSLSGWLSLPESLVRVALLSFASYMLMLGLVGIVVARGAFKGVAADTDSV